ncbi:MAG TPA: proton-conducting transporter membrane subunit [Candidatus Acidoferrales bacterium]|nr:proton-conducting transporter membrane subunit [Candidatus Acidoferrales bacterium]
MWLLLAMAILLAGAVAVLLLSRSDRNLSRLGAGSVVLAAALGSIPVVQVLLGGPAVQFHFPWPVPFGEFFIELDPLSAWFLVPTLLLSALAAVYGVGYLRSWQGKRSLGPIWFFYGLLVLGMMLVLLARNAVLFLVAWELMAVASFFLVTFEHERPSVREAGWIYFVATHLGTAFLLALFLLLARETGSMDFDVWARQGIHTAGLANVLFVLAVVGFGTKAGFMPLHVWLPEAHPAAPSHVSALMSGVMIKTGIYGLVRSFTFLGTPPLWWGWVLVAIGLSSGVLGVLFALAQHDLKRLLAYHSVENIGIIALGLGVGLLGMSTNLPVLMVLGFGGGLLHVLNHALFKGLLFLGAGAVGHETGTLEIDQLGGLLKRMPWTAVTFLIAAVAISGLPPLNGFVSEFLIFLGAFKAGISTGGPIAVPSLALIAGLALIGGLAVACFTKAFGIIFLGEPRSEHTFQAHEVAWTMRLPMLVLAAGCVVIGLSAPAVVAGLQRVLGNVTALRPEVVGETLAAASSPLTLVIIGALTFLLLVAMLVLVRRGLLAGRPVSESATWGCGYVQPTARMQYTASSFAQPLTDLFQPLLGTKKTVVPARGLFPAEAALKTETPDLSREEMYRPMFERAEAWLSQLRWLQHGNVQLYILYIAATLMVLLIWKFR